MTADFISGYAAAVANLGSEGDYRNVDWSGPFNYLRERLATFEAADTLVDRLRLRGELYAEAADEIERMQSALKPFADAAKSFTPYPENMADHAVDGRFTLAQIRAAAKARGVTA